MDIAEANIFIDAKLNGLGSRTLIPAIEVRDALLDVRNLLAGEKPPTSHQENLQNERDQIIQFLGTNSTRVVRVQLERRLSEIGQELEPRKEEDVNAN